MITQQFAPGAPGIEPRWTRSTASRSAAATRSPEASLTATMLAALCAFSKVSGSVFVAVRPGTL